MRPENSAVDRDLSDVQFGVVLSYDEDAATVSGEYITCLGHFSNVPWSVMSLGDVKIGMSVPNKGDVVEILSSGNTPVGARPFGFYRATKATSNLRKVKSGEFVLESSAGRMFMDRSGGISFYDSNAHFLSLSGDDEWVSMDSKVCMIKGSWSSFRLGNVYRKLPDEYGVVRELDVNTPNPALLPYQELSIKVLSNGTLAAGAPQAWSQVVKMGDICNDLGVKDPLTAFSYQLTNPTMITYAKIEVGYDSSINIENTLAGGSVKIAANGTVVLHGTLLSPGVARVGDSVTVTLMPVDIQGLATALLATGAFLPTGDPPAPPPLPVVLNSGVVSTGSLVVKAG